MFCNFGAGLTISFPKKFDYTKSISVEIKSADCDGLKEQNHNKIISFCITNFHKFDV